MRCVRPRCVRIHKKSPYGVLTIVPAGTGKSVVFSVGAKVPKRQYWHAVFDHVLSVCTVPAQAVNVLY